MADARRRQWLAVDTHYASSKLALGLREHFGIIGVTVFDLFLRACKRNAIQGEVTYNSDQDFLAQIGMPGLVLVNETGTAWTLDEFFTYVGQQKNTRRTRRGGLTVVSSTRWEQWENTRSKARNIGPLPARNESNAGADNDSDHDIDNDLDNEGGIAVVADEVEIPASVWSEYAKRRFAMQSPGSIRHPLKWIQATERKACEEHWLRAQHLLHNFDINHEQLVVLLLHEGGSPQWLTGLRKEHVS